MTGEKKFNAWIPNFGAKGWGITLTCFVFFIFFTFWNSVTNTLFGIFGEQYGWQQTDSRSLLPLLAGFRWSRWFCSARSAARLARKTCP